MEFHKIPALPGVRLGWKLLTVKITPPYYAMEFIIAVQSCSLQAQSNITLRKLAAFSKCSFGFQCHYKI
jgi:hypothetical protein